MNSLINLFLYNAVWLLCVTGGDRSACVALLLLAVHFLVSSCRKNDVRLAGILLVAGLLIDGTLAAVGFFSFHSPGFPIPLWLATIWLALATLPNHSLTWLKGRPLLNAVFGAIGGPLAYWGGVRLGAATFNWPLPASLLLLAAVWALIWPLVMLASDKTGTDLFSSLIKK